MLDISDWYYVLRTYVINTKNFAVTWMLAYNGILIYADHSQCYVCEYMLATLG